MNRCEVVGFRNLADGGISCTRVASQQCSDCGIETCESHTEKCGVCQEMFCPSCLSFHQREHAKAPRTIGSKQRERKSA